MKKVIFSVIVWIASTLATNAMAQDLEYNIKTIDGKKYYEYPVQKSEGFYSVSKKFHVSEDEIKKANPSSEAGLKKGEILLIPVNEYIVHKVSKSETLFSIKEKYKVTYDDIYKYNPTVKEEGLKYGTEIRIPKVSVSQTAEQPKTPLPQKENAATIKKDNDKNFTYHKITEGETLTSIAKKYGISTNDIIKINPEAKDGIKKGKMLIIPPTKTNKEKDEASKPTTPPVFAMNTPKDTIAEQTKKPSFFKAHKVQKKETIYSISKMYGITQEELTKLNPSISNGLQVGQILTIPAPESIATKPAEVSPVSSSGMIRIHRVKKKETLSSIAKDYNVTEEAIILVNPEAKDGIKKGMTLTIPSSPDEGKNIIGTHTIQKGDTRFKLIKTYEICMDSLLKYNPNAKEHFNVGSVMLISMTLSPTATMPDTSTYRLHKVKKGETVFGIAKQYGTPQKDLEYMNPGSETELKEGRILIIPNTKEEENVRVAVEPKNTVNVAIALPFQLSSQAGKNTVDANTERFIEVYQGALLAIDSLKNRGLNINLYVYDSGKTEAEAKKALNTKEMAEMDLLIGPAYASQIKAFSDIAKEKNVKLIVPFSSKSEETALNSNIYQINTPQHIQYELTAKAIIDKFRGNNIVLLRFKNETYNDKKVMGDSIASYLRKNNVQFTEASYSNIESLKSVLSQKSDNAVVVLTTNQVALNQTLPIVNMLGEKHTISVVGFPEWQKYASISKDLFVLNTFVPSTFCIDFKQQEVHNYIKKFRKVYKYEPQNEQPQYGMLGYDIMMFFCEAVEKYGHNFESKITEISYKPLQAAMSFKKLNNNSGYYNGCIFFTNHNSETGITFTKYE